MSCFGALLIGSVLRALSICVKNEESKSGSCDSFAPLGCFYLGKRVTPFRNFLSAYFRFGFSGIIFAGMLYLNLFSVNPISRLTCRNHHWTCLKECASFPCTELLSFSFLGERIGPDVHHYSSTSPGWG